MLPEWMQWLMFWMVTILFVEINIILPLGRISGKYTERLARTISQDFLNKIQEARFRAEFELTNDEVAVEKMREFCQARLSDEDAEHAIAHLKDDYCALITVAATESARAAAVRQLAKLKYYDMSNDMRNGAQEVLEQARDHLQQVGIDVDALEAQYRR